MPAGAQTEITLLGTAGWMPTTRRETSCILVRSESSALLLDAGTGVRRLVSDPDLLSNVSQLTILLSHFHLDHVVGLSYLTALPASIRRTIWGPGAWCYGTSTPSILSRVLTPPVIPLPLEATAEEFAELRPGRNVVSGLELEVRMQEKHTAPSVSFRLGDLLAYCTDTAYDEGNSELASGVNYLFHEAWSGSDGDKYHSSASEAGAVAAGAACDHLVLVHLNEHVHEDSTTTSPCSNFAAAMLGEDLAEFVI